MFWADAGDDLKTYQIHGLLDTPDSFARRLTWFGYVYICGQCCGCDMPLATRSHVSNIKARKSIPRRGPMESRGDPYVTSQSRGIIVVVYLNTYL